MWQTEPMQLPLCPKRALGVIFPKGRKAAHCSKKKRLIFLPLCRFCGGVSWEQMSERSR